MKLQPAPGMRDFDPAQCRRRRRVIETISSVYESYGYEPIETPVLERLEILTGHGGGENERLIFKTLKRGEQLTKALNGGSHDLADLGLRYDLTTPLARFAAAHPQHLDRLFKRYHMAPVWRADRPQRGRFREFMQCDLDAVGSTSPMIEAEVLAAGDQALAKLGFEDVTIHLNDRRVLSGMMDACGVPAALTGDALVALDKIDKVGQAGVEEELGARGVTADAVASIFDGMKRLEDTSVKNNSGGQEALLELKAVVPALNPAISANLATIMRLLEESGSLTGKVRFDPSLVRGMSYYSGPVFEFSINEKDGGPVPFSIAGGGRYDGLIGRFSGRDLPACGLSLGFERLLTLMEEWEMFQDDEQNSVVFMPLFDEAIRGPVMAAAHRMREAGLQVLLYPEAIKLGKQFKFASAHGCDLAAVIGADELADSSVEVKSVRRKERQRLPLSEAIAWFKERVR